MDITLNYIEKGSGTPLILLHGNGEDHTYFQNQIEEFSHKFHVIAIDTRGHGLSPRGSTPFTLTQFAEDLHDFMMEHDIAKANLLGFSDGGNIALVFTLKYPQMVDKLILDGANLYPSGLKRNVMTDIGKEYEKAKLSLKQNPEALKDVEMLELMIYEPNISPKELRQIKSRTLVIAGTKDMIKDSHTRLIYNNLPNAELAIIIGNHFVANKNPGEFNKRVMEFL